MAYPMYMILMLLLSTRNSWSHAPVFVAFHTVLPQERCQFIRFDKHLPHMEVGRSKSPSLPHLRDVDRHQFTHERAVERVVTKNAFRFKDTGYVRNDFWHIAYMLQSVAAEDKVEGAVPVRECLSCPFFILYLQAACLRMAGRYLQRLFRRSESGDIKTHAKARDRKSTRLNS